MAVAVDDAVEVDDVVVVELPLDDSVEVDVEELVLVVLAVSVDDDESVSVSSLVDVPVSELLSVAVSDAVSEPVEVSVDVSVMFATSRTNKAFMLLDPTISFPSANLSVLGVNDREPKLTSLLKDCVAIRLGNTLVVPSLFLRLITLMLSLPASST